MPSKGFGQSRLESALPMESFKVYSTSTDGASQLHLPLAVALQPWQVGVAQQNRCSLRSIAITPTEVHLEL